MQLQQRLNLFQREPQLLTLLDKTNVVQIALRIHPMPRRRPHRLPQNPPPLIKPHRLYVHPSLRRQLSDSHMRILNPIPQYRVNPRSGGRICPPGFVHAPYDLAAPPREAYDMRRSGLTLGEVSQASQWPTLGRYIKTPGP